MKKPNYAARYNIRKTFEYNKQHGPYEKVTDKNKAIQKALGTYGIRTNFFGFTTKLPIGVAAGSLFNTRYMDAALKDGFEVVTWKTWRSTERIAHRTDGSHVGHNIVFLPSDEITSERMGARVAGTLAYTGAPTEVSITNSFGMPSPGPLEWMPQVAQFEQYAHKKNKCVITSVVGTPRSGDTLEDLARDYAFTARCAEMMGAHIIELNLSCPNVEGKEGMIYKTCPDARLVAQTTREFLTNTDTKLLLKVGYASKDHYKTLLEACAPFVDGIVAINTIAMEVVDQDGKQALPGGKTSGTCGSAIIGRAVEAVEHLVAARAELGDTAKHIKIIGCGGVTDAESFMRHIDAGAEFVMCATAALFNPDLPMHIAKHIAAHKITKTI
jgi:dihydroorotate dehydrogenase